MALGATAARSLFGRVITISKVRGECLELADQTVVSSDMSQSLDALCCLVNDGRNLVQRFFPYTFAAEAMPQYRTKVVQGATNRRAIRLIARRREVSEAGEQRIHLRRIGGEIGTASLCDGKRLSGALQLGPFDVAQVLEHRQRRIDDAGAGDISAPRQILDRADEVITVPRLIRDELEQDEPQIR